MASLWTSLHWLQSQVSRGGSTEVVVPTLAAEGFFPEVPAKAFLSFEGPGVFLNPSLLSGGCDTQTSFHSGSLGVI